MYPCHSNGKEFPDSVVKPVKADNRHCYHGDFLTPQLLLILGSPSGDGEDYENEPPLLEELGINFSHIKEKTFAVLNPVGSASAEIN
ncbi:hypothetical protein NECAME_17058 [Necator americanus]|uniref:Uncharacterized protein n=1 Tax=Necator americanus TaxID=51031 RepID=W2TUC3_NECAM|nr:hypothetical protein NECAME_17058 [Necator americanus]ETN84652.1 hypothetical protein NECAME_17058 [Necator americanus]